MLRRRARVRTWLSDHPEFQAAAEHRHTEVHRAVRKKSGTAFHRCYNKRSEWRPVEVARACT
ncbi:hypothetical protein CPB84DRAFT_1779344 [Gymnopilus junonius]|uniref:Uncharacterized protein n=1 Tax=Gymnopilus junonius TaxID=109634 RepID=A0A9P5NP95_GYMJU|nr:hypothetical protein CPB84DRAFT_1779344 [Gymnopilus junonius]